jgi:predicted metal-dependent peptidase
MVHYGKTDPEWNLRDNGANDQEIAFLRRAYANGWRGQRVELNALTSDQFVNWLDSKLAEHGARKLIPDEEILQQAYRRAVAVARYQEAIDKVRKEISAEAAESPVPADLAKKIGRLLKRDPELSWDQAIVRLAGRRKA